MEASAADRARRLLVLGAGPAQLGLLEAARRRDLFVIAADRDPDAPGFRFADRRALVSTEDEEGLERLAASERVSGIVAPGIDWPVAIAARIAARLGLPHPVDPDAAALATSKLKQRRRLAEAGVPQPRWELRGSEPQSRPFEVPCVVKAPDRQGQRGLSLVRTEEELAPALERARRASRSGLALVEELVDGPEVTVNAFVRDGAVTALTVTDRLTGEPPAFGVALAHAWPAAAPADAAEVAARAVVALGIRNGPAYTQLRVASDGAKVVEVAARLGGGHDAELCAAATGVDLNALALAGALGEAVAPPEPSSRVGGACVRFLVAPPGELRGVEGVDDARSAEGVVDVRLYRRQGHRFGPLRTGADRAGAVLAVGGSRDEALEVAGRAAERIRFDVADVEALV